ncbi:Golgin subfamily A member 2, partial [Fasciolopsis buskii]
ERNVELASLLEKRSRAHERALAKLSVIQEQSTRAANQAANDKAKMEATAQRDLSKAMEQVSVDTAVMTDSFVVRMY